MTWQITLEVVDCDAPSSVLAGAKVSLGAIELGHTDASGRFVASLDDFDTKPIFKISKQDFVTNNFSFDKNAASGSVQTVCLRNPSTIPDGHDPDIPGESGGQEFDGGCFIVSAATGSTSSFEVTRLRALRDRIRTSSRLGGDLIDRVYGEYFQFSPVIATKVQQDALTREVVLQAIVRPLFAWYTLAGMLGFDEADEEGVGQCVQDILTACPAEFGETIVAVLEALRCEGELPPDTPQLIVDLAAQIAHFRFASWAILDPLIRVWHAATDQLDVVDEVADWLASAPLESLSLSDAELEDELDVLASFLSFKPSARLQLGDRLSAAWPDAGSALQHSGFVTHMPTTEKDR